MKLAFKIGPVALALLTLGGCSPSAPVWEYQTRAVPTSAKDATLATSGAQGWELVSSQEARAGSDAEIKKLQDEKETENRKIASSLYENYKFVSLKNDRNLADLAEELRHSFVESENIAEIEAEVKATNKWIYSRQNGMMGTFAGVEAALIRSGFQHSIKGATTKIEILKKLQVAQSSQCKLVFKRQKHR